MPNIWCKKNLCELLLVGGRDRNAHTSEKDRYYAIRVQTFEILLKLLRSELHVIA